jgi:hypothetical protein
MGCFGKPVPIRHNGHECVAAIDSRAASKSSLSISTPLPSMTTRRGGTSAGYLMLIFKVSLAPKPTFEPMAGDPSFLTPAKIDAVSALLQRRFVTSIIKTPFTDEYEFSPVCPPLVS